MSKASEILAAGRAAGEDPKETYRKMREAGKAHRRASKETAQDKGCPACWLPWSCCKCGHTKPRKR